MNIPPTITQLEMSDADIELAERAAKRLGYTQTAYTSTSGLWGLFCLPDRASQRKGCFIKTREFGLLFVADLEDLNLHTLAEEERKAAKGTKFAIGQKVTFTNDQGCKFPGKTITEIRHTPKGTEYFYTPTDTPWCPVREDQLKPTRETEAV